MKSALFLVLLALSPFAFAGNEAGGGESSLLLSCNNNAHPSVSFRVQIVTGFFEVDGKSVWTTGADIYRNIHFTNEETLIESVAVEGNEAGTEFHGKGFSLEQSRPSNLDMKSFQATMKLDGIPDQELWCETN